MKKFKFKWLLLSFILSITSINQMWAYDYYWKGNIYFLAPDDWNLETNSHVQLGLVQGNTTNTAHYVSAWGDMDRIGSTRLYFIKGDATHTGYANQEYVAFIANNTTWSSNSFRLDGCAGYTTPSDYRFTSYDHPYLYVPNSDSNGATLSGSYCSDGSEYGDKIRNLLNKTQTIYIYTNGSASDAGGTVNLTGTEKGYGTTDCNSVDATSTSNTLSQNTCIGSINTLTATAESGYYFAGWFNSGTAGGSVESSPYTCKGAKTIYACFENRYTVTVSAGAHGRITSGSSSVSAGYYTNPTISAEAYGENSDQYRFLKWVCTGGASVANETSETTTVSATAAGTVTAQFVSVWTLKGGNSSSEDGNDALGDWKVFNSMDYTGTAYEYKLEIPLAEKTTYQFQLYDYPNDTWYRYGSEDYQLAFVGQSNAYNWDLENTAGKQNMVLMTANSGTYTFTYNSNTKRLTVGFPDQSHPNTDNIYFKNSGASPYTNVYAHIWGGTKGSTGGGRLPKLPTCEFDGQTYYYAAIGIDNDKCLFANSEDIKTGSPSKTSDQSDIDEKVGKYYDLETGTWKDFTATLTLTHHIATNSPTPASITVTYNSDNNLTGDVLTKDPTNANYSFQGYYTADGGGGDLLINTSGAVQNVTGYTSSGKWIRKSSAEVFAKWTQSVTLNMNGGDDSNSSVTLTYNSASHAAISTPSRANYTFAGWYTAASDGSLVIATDGTMQANVTNYTGAGGIWTRNNATNVLYAQWTEKKHMVTIAAGSNGSVDPTSVSNVGVVTTSGDITATGNTGYKFVNWTLVDGVTLADGYVNTDETIRINATADSKTITANFTAKQCAITFDKEGGEGGSNSTTATYGVAMSDVEIPHQIGYKFDGYFDGDNGTGNQYYKADGTSYTAWNKNTEEDTKLYAKWTADNNVFTGTDGDWTKSTNWSAGKVPTDDWSAVTISKPVTITDAYVHIGSLTIADGGSLTIAEDGALEVAGTISNSVAGRLVIETSSTKQGALIFNSTGSTAANVNMTMNAEDEMFQFIAIPVSLVSVNPTFAGTGKYTYVWSNKDHTWERRGYYDDIYSFEAVLLKGQGTAEFNGNLVSTGNITYSGSYSSTGYNSVYMYGNSWTAPIKLSAGMYDNVSIGIMKGTNNSWDGGIVNDVIPALQAFGVAVGSSKATGSFTINYDTDVRNPSYPNEPLRAPQRQTADVRPIAIYVSGNDMQTRIRLLEDATRFTDDLDAGWEAYYLAGQGLAGEMYAVGPEAKMNVLATSNLEGTVVGFVPGQATDYTISFTGDGKGYYLNDIATGESTLIDEANTYNFKSDENTNATRFVVSKMPLMPTGVDEVADGSKARKQMIDGTLYIIRDGRIYDAQGALVK